jgi:PadR family transcriptional regulator PadR
MKGETLKGHLELLLLSALKSQPAHGYAIAETLRSRSGGVFDLPEGTLYPALHRLERAGLVSSRWSEHAGRRRRVYRATVKGQEVLAVREQEWGFFVRAVQGVLGGA